MPERRCGNTHEMRKPETKFTSDAATAVGRASEGRASRQLGSARGLDGGGVRRTLRQSRPGTRTLALVLRALRQQAQAQYHKVPHGGVVCGSLGVRVDLVGVEHVSAPAVEEGLDVDHFNPEVAGHAGRARVHLADQGVGAQVVRVVVPGSPHQGGGEEQDRHPR